MAVLIQEIRNGASLQAKTVKHADGEATISIWYAEDVVSLHISSLRLMPPFE
jgi:hypothetical protein